MIYISKMLLDIFENKNLNFDKIEYPKTEGIYLVQGEYESYFYLFIIVDSKEIKNFIVDFQPEIYSFFNEEYMNDEKYKIKIKKGFEKNTTLILCTLSEGLIGEIENIEEDPYFFKKQVLRLNEIEYNYIKDVIPDGEYLNTIQKTILNKDLFLKFLTEYEYRYSLAAKLYEKIPFLNLNMQIVQRKNLDDIIDDSIRGLSVKHLQIKNLIIESKDEDFQEMMKSKVFK